MMSAFVKRGMPFDFGSGALIFLEIIVMNGRKWSEIEIMAVKSLIVEGNTYQQTSNIIGRRVSFPEKIFSWTS